MQVETIGDEPNVRFRAGKFNYQVDGEFVHVSKDSGDSIISIASHKYKDNDTACEMAWRMACRQSRA